MTITYLIVPGWQNSGPTHWQSHWETQYRMQRVNQSDWLHAERHAWVATLEQAIQKVVAQGNQPVIVAHSLGCMTLAHLPKAALASVRAALLVAPPDVERPDLPPQITGFSPIPRDPLPFPAQVIASDNDPYCQLPRAQTFAQAWAVPCQVMIGAGHINSESGLGAWPQGYEWLQTLLQPTPHPDAP
ncbi:RBBP9/YdeN family alpha/beta hydrolase [Parvibium lacunae]|uniref:Alpha/beta hydrolase n=1 Tax=Parvibium lacunae TaxID=1888893 RepID=A0A368L3K0_9BURK|nr:alpha/beta hydrolase [Parvibium lacunae]RCS58149.1 alpha/beta hydrolase [Parvibium lacunae]